MYRVNMPLQVRFLAGPVVAVATLVSVAQLVVTFAVFNPEEFNS